MTNRKLISTGKTGIIILSLMLLQIIGNLCSATKCLNQFCFIRKTIFLLIFHFFLVFHNAAGQANKDVDSLKLLLRESSADSTRLELLRAITNAYFFVSPDSSLLYATEGRELSIKTRNPKVQILLVSTLGESQRLLGDFVGSLRAQFEALALSQENKFVNGEANALGCIGLTYVELGDFTRGIEYLHAGLFIHRRISEKVKIAFELSNLGYAYDLSKNPDSALFYQRIAKDSSRELIHGPLRSLILNRLGGAFAEHGMIDSAMYYFDLGLANIAMSKEKVNLGRILGQKAKLYFRTGKYDSAMLFARSSFANNTKSSQRLELMEMSRLLSRLYHRIHKYDSAYFYTSIAAEMMDSLYGPQKFKNLQTLIVDEQDRQRKAEQVQERYRNGIRYGALISGLIGLVLVSTILLRKNNRKQKANAQLLKENKEAQLQLLKAQIHPHFLFNTLNNIYSQAQKESPESADMIMELAHILRYMLDETKHELVPLESELQLITDYVNLEKMRYGEQLDLYISFPSNTADLYITPLMLLPFVENCFKHGTSKVLHHPWINFKIELEENLLSLKLMNGKNSSKSSNNKRTGTGIENAKRRLELLYPGNYEMQVIEEDDVFIVNLKMKLVNKDAVANHDKTENQGMMTYP